MAEEGLTEREKVPNACPHCSNKLTPWQQVLLATDRALVCKKCWYRIILDVIPSSNKTDSEKSKSEGSND